MEHTLKNCTAYLENDWDVVERGSLSFEAVHLQLEKTKRRGAGVTTEKAAKRKRVESLVYMELWVP